MADSPNSHPGTPAPPQEYFRQRLEELEAEVAGLRCQAARGRLLFEQSSLGILIVDANGLIFDANPRALALLGYDGAELRGQGVASLLHPDDPGCPIPDGARQNDSDAPIRGVEGRYRRKNGSWLPVVASIGLFDRRKGLFQLMLQDISAAKVAEEAKTAALIQAQAAGQAKSAFLANMSHEIRTPLNGIMGMIQLALSSALSEEQRDYLLTALTSAEALLCVLSDVLDVSRLDAGRVILSDDVFELGDVIRPMTASFDHEARLKGLNFTSVVAPGTPASLRGDPARLRQILYNLIANAIKYTPSGGIRLSVAPVETDADRALLDFVVQDTGIGILPDKQESVFDAFSQADPSLTRPYGGTGLGLAIVYGLTKLMGGQVNLCSEPGRGTAVKIRLSFPLGKMTNLEPKHRPVPRIVGTRVLVVEDERINQLTIRAMLQKFGCQPIMAANGLEALSFLSAQEFDCILMDMQMPILDGLETTRRIRKGQGGVKNPKVHIIALTAHTLDADRENALAAGVSDYISKPVNMDELARAIGRCLGIFT